jgi:hypothetical protein
MLHSNYTDRGSTLFWSIDNHTIGIKMKVLICKKVLNETESSTCQAIDSPHLG